MNEHIDYNSERPLLIIPEYGRHIQKMIDHCVALEDREERNKMAMAIITVMGNLQPHLRNVPDFKHKLWDQMHIMSDFKLEVDSKYKAPSKEELQEKPEPLKYPKAASKYRFYGNNIQIMIDTALSWEDSELKEVLIYTIANHMKKCFLNWNKDTVEDGVIFQHLHELSDGKIDLRNSEEVLSLSYDLLKKRKTQGQNHSKNNNKRQHKSKKSKN